MSMPEIDPRLFADLESRGLVKQTTDPKLHEILSKERITVYAGFDPTADSLHLGNLLPLLTLRRFQLAGHRVIALAGGATGLVGDPSGKASERTLQEEDRIATNVEGVKRVLSRFIDLSDPAKGILVNNIDWFKDITFLDFLRDVGKHFTVNHMMGKESIRARLEDRDHGISYTEFTYMLLQAYDYFVLNEREGCRLQIGGSDQWGNITAGGELIRRIRASRGQDAHEAYGLTLPLITKADGSKFGKSEKGSVWLDADKTSPFAFYQFLVQQPDAEVINLIRYFTFLPDAEIARLEECVKSAPERREAQLALARELTTLVHEREELSRIERATAALFGEEIKTLDERTLLDVFSEAPAYEHSGSELRGTGVPLVDLLVASGVCASKGAARKDIQGGGIYVNNERTSDVALLVGAGALLHGKFVVLRKGKKQYTLVRAGA